MESMNHAAVTAEFYEEYARSNALDTVQLCMLDLLYQSNGPITLVAMRKALDCSRSRLVNTIRDLEDQDLVIQQADCVELTLSAPFVIEEILEDLHKKFDRYARKHVEDLEMHLLA